MFGSKNKKYNPRNWYSTRYQVVIIQRNILLLFTFLSLIAVSISIIFVKQISTSRTLEPYVIELEEKTGVATVVEQKTRESFTEDEALKRYFALQYVNAVEGYNPATYVDDYNKVRLFSSSKVFGQLRYKLSTRNENSPASQLGRNGRIDVKIKSIQFLEPTVVQIRVRLDAVGNNIGNLKRQRDAIIYMSFAFANLNLQLKDRYINPLGFQVTKYAIEDEIVNY